MFRFAIGDIVYHRLSIPLASIGNGWGIEHRGVYSLPMIVLERLSQDCPGGTQLKYSVMTCSGPTTYLEIELMPASTWQDEQEPLMATKTFLRHARRAADRLPSNKTAKALTELLNGLDV